MPNELTTFDYGPLGVCAGPVKGIADRIRLRLKRAHEDIIEIGTSLNEARSLLKTAETFDAWIAAEFDGLSRTTAYRFMAVAKAFGGLLVNGATITPGALYALANPKVSEEQIAMAAGMANEGIRVDGHVASHIIHPDPPSHRGTNEETEDKQECRKPDGLDDEPADDSAPEEEPETKSAPPPKPKHAPVFDQIESLVLTAKELFAASAQECDESDDVLTSLNDSMNRLSYYVRQVEEA